jgi:D-cysteine desulfhydrase
VKALTYRLADRSGASGALAELWPMLERFPRLASLPRVTLRDRVSPVQETLVDGARLWIKRDDLNAATVGGNKVRCLEFLLAGVASGDSVATAGAWGSTHCLATAVHGAARGARVRVGLWPQEMNAVARRVESELREQAEVVRFPSPVVAIPWLWWRAARGDRVIPPGGTTPSGMLGHVNAALELARQIARGELPSPRQVVVPLGTGGTMAGLALGFAIAGLSLEIVGARVTPRIVARLGRVRRLAAATRRRLEQASGERIRVELPPMRIIHDVYGGAYGRPLARGRARLDGNTQAVELDPTYSAKACTAALEIRNEGPTLFWMTFDGRWLAARRRNDG